MKSKIENPDNNNLQGCLWTFGNPIQRFHFVFGALIITLCAGVAFSQQNPVQYVNPFIGTGGHGHTFPGAVWPFGMVQLSPDTRVDGSWDGCSGYHYSDKKIYGFSHTHLSGTGCSDWGDILVLPCTDEVSVSSTNYASPFNHHEEKSGAGYYKVQLQKYAVQAELTVTQRVGIHRYTYLGKGSQKLLIDLLHRDKTLESGFTWKDSLTLTGYRISQAWAKKQVLYFAIRFSKPVMAKWLSKAGSWHASAITRDLPQEQALLEFNGTDQLLLKVALSPVSEEGALNNLESEAPHWDFDRYRKEVEMVWEKKLSKIQIQSSDKNTATVFYTALYHCFIHPSLSMDVDGQYRGRDDKIHKAQGFSYYSVFSLWDTYRALHPLLNILEPEISNDFIRTFLEQYRQAGRLPVWELSSNETECMIGFHSVPVILDAYQKGIRSFDTQLALEAMIAASNYSAFGIPVFNKQGYLQVDDENESVSKSLEYAYDNWCIARYAALIGKSPLSALHDWRALSYRNLFDQQSGHMRPRKNGNWLHPFYPEEINNHFTEGNSWQYSFYVPQDVEGLMALHGGRQAFEDKLDALFKASSKTRGREQADVTGLIGQYAHGNEPSHHMAYLYNYTDSPQKASVYTHQIMKEFYSNNPDGLIGNEDCGQMSAWYVFTALGFYPVCPGSNQFALVRPYFNSITVELPGSKKLHIQSKTIDLKGTVGYRLNQKVYSSAFVNYEDLIRAEEFEFIQSDKLKSYTAPKVTIPEKDYIPAPVIDAPGRVFKDSVRVQVNRVNYDSALFYYSLNGDSVNENSPVYTSPIVIKQEGTIRVKAKSMEGHWSTETISRLNKIKYNYDLTISARVNSQYKADGPQTLFDGIYGDWNWRKGDWLGYQGQELQIIVDLKELKRIQSIQINTLQDRQAWIFFPPSVEFFGSEDGKSFELFEKKDCDKNLASLDICALKFGTHPERNARYLKIILKYPGKLPQWHPGAGGESFIFVDELEIQSAAPATN